jgi:hypothetical protein
LIQRFKQRLLFIVCESLFIAGCIVGAGAGRIVQFGAGKVLVGFATGLLLVIALPPVVRSFPPQRMVMTSAWVNIGFFGAVTVGPLIGGAVASAHVWRWFYAGLAVIGCIALLVSLFTLPDQPPPDPGQRLDKPALLLGLAATTLPFWAAGELTGHGFSNYLFMVPVAVGIACFVALLLTQYHQEQPLSPVKPMWKAVPIAGILVAMFGGAALVTMMELLQKYQITVLHATPLATGLLFWPEVIGTIITAVLLGAFIRSRLLATLPAAGMVVLIVAAALMLFISDRSSPSLVLAITGLLGLGAGSTVAPGLWLAGFSLPSVLVGRTFAVVELVRSEADFIIAPVMLLWRWRSRAAPCFHKPAFIRRCG